MVGMNDAVKNGIAHIEVGAGHIDLSTEDLFAVGILAVLHFFKEL